MLIDWPSNWRQEGQNTTFVFSKAEQKLQDQQQHQHDQEKLTANNVPHISNMSRVAAKHYNMYVGKAPLQRACRNAYGP